jgi:hypothetical protein
MRKPTYTKWAKCDCGDWTLCRRDGDGHSCAACDQFIAEVHAAIDQGILEQRKELKPNKWDMFKRR